MKWYLGSSTSLFLAFLPFLQQQPQVVDLTFRHRILFREERGGDHQHSRELLSYFSLLSVITYFALFLLFMGLGYKVYVHLRKP